MNRRSADAVPLVGKLAEILSGPMGEIAVQHLRIRPRQARSVESVDRLLSAAVIAAERRHSGKISIETIAAEAGVTPQAAYRYFKDADELIRTALRCAAVREHERLIVVLSGRSLPDEAEMARSVVGLVLDACDRIHSRPVHLQAALIQEYRQVGYDASLVIAGLICRPHEVADVRPSLDIIKVSVALTATIAIATFRAERFASLRGSEIEGLLATLFVGVLQGAGSAFDAFREMGFDFAAGWSASE